MTKTKAKYRPPFRVYTTYGWREYKSAVVCESLAELTKHGQGLYNLSENSWYAEDANGVLIENDDIPKTFGFYEVTLNWDDSISKLFSGWHAGSKKMPTKRQILYSTCTGPSMGMINKDRDRLRIGYGKTEAKALQQAKNG